MLELKTTMSTINLNKTQTVSIAVKNIKIVTSKNKQSDYPEIVLNSLKKPVGNTHINNFILRVKKK